MYDLEGLLVLEGVLDEKIQLSNVPALNVRLRIDEMARHQSYVVESVPMKDLFICRHLGLEPLHVYLYPAYYLLYVPFVLLVQGYLLLGVL